jgi:uncharacterized protein YjbI with pentapeptide repeats
MKTTTLQRLRENNERGYDLIANYVGVDFTGDIPLETILDNNGLQDCIWSLRATDGGKEIAQEFAIRVAMKVYFAPAWVKWANGWLDGTDRSKGSATAAAAAADAAVAAAVTADAAADAYAAAAAAAAAAADANLYGANLSRANLYGAAAAAYAAAYAYAYAAREKMKSDNMKLLRSLIK